MSENETTGAAILRGLACRCPRCGQAPLFEGFLKPAPACPDCGLDYAFTGDDGPAIFIIFLVSPIVIVLAFVLEAVSHPAPYVHLIVWIPVTIVLSLALLRPFKGAIVALQYRHNAHEGHL